MRCIGYGFGAIVSALALSGAQAATITVDADGVGVGPGQVISVNVSGTEQVAGLNFYLQLGDGGVFVGGSETAPVITGVDLITNTIFASNHTTPTADTVEPLAYAGGVTTNSGTVLANGLMATITVDTSSLQGNSFTMRLVGVAPSLGGFDTELLAADSTPIAMNFAEQVVTVAVPEPGTLFLLGLTSASMLLRPKRSV